MLQCYYNVLLVRCSATKLQRNNLKCAKRTLFLRNSNIMYNIAVPIYRAKVDLLHMQHCLDTCCVPKQCLFFLCSLGIAMHVYLLSYNKYVTAGFLVTLQAVCNCWATSRTCITTISFRNVAAR